MSEISFSKLRQVMSTIEEFRSDLKSGNLDGSSAKHKLMPDEPGWDSKIASGECLLNFESLEAELDNYMTVLKSKQLELTCFSWFIKVLIATTVASALGYKYMSKVAIGYTITTLLVISLLAIFLKVYLNYSFGKMESKFERDFSEKLCR